MPRTIFVANFDETVDDHDLEELFSRYGKVLNARVWLDLESGKSRGFGFVEMQEDSEAECAIECLGGT